MTASGLPSTLARPVTHELVIKKSRFIADLEPVGDSAAADAVVARLRQESWDASHHCVAMLLGEHADRARSSDDGEPSGTAGVPMTEVLRRRNMTDVVAVVTRYFGGVKLGTGGLMRAYSDVVAEALDLAETGGAVLRRAMLHEVEVPVPYAEAGRFDHLLREWAGTHGSLVRQSVYDDVARLRLLVPAARLTALHGDLAASSSGSVVPVVGELRVVDLPA